jgi:hypothetical protein
LSLGLRESIRVTRNTREAFIQKRTKISIFLVGLSNKQRLTSTLGEKLGATRIGDPNLNWAQALLSHGITPLLNTQRIGYWHKILVGEKVVIAKKW